MGRQVEVGLPCTGSGGQATRLCLPPLRRVTQEGGPPNVVVWEAFHEGTWQPVANTPWAALTCKIPAVHHHPLQACLVGIC